MNIENAAVWGFWVATETKWLIQRHLGCRKFVPDHQKNSKTNKTRKAEERNSRALSWKSNIEEY